MLEAPYPPYRSTRGSLVEFAQYRCFTVQLTWIPTECMAGFVACEPDERGGYGPDVLLGLHRRTHLRGSRQQVRLLYLIASMYIIS